MFNYHGFSGKCPSPTTSETVARIMWMQFCPGIEASDEDKKQYLACADEIIAPLPVSSLQKVMDAAEVLSTAMVESEANGADYEMVDEPWQHLTAAIQAVYAAMPSPDPLQDPT